MPKNDISTQLREFLDLILELKVRRLTKKEIAKTLNKSERTAERMIQFLKENYPDEIEEVEQNISQEKHWRLKSGKLDKFINLSDGEIAKLEMLKNNLKNSVEKDQITKIINKISIRNNTKNNKIDIDELLRTQGYAVKQGVKEKFNFDIGRIYYALESKCKLYINYKDAYGNEYNGIKFSPYGIKIGDFHYLIGKEDGNNTIKSYKLSRISYLRCIEEENADIDETFNLEEYCNKSFGIYTTEPKEIVIKFSSEVKNDIYNYEFHPTQKIEEQEDGSFLLTFKASGYYEIITELLKWRDTVEVIKPQELKVQYIKTIKDMYNNILKV